jgi:beta-phosphoglucomutase-like phosphatase (HAD superfamily)
MSARERMARRGIPLQLVIFDCDGVLVDSEAIADRVVAASLTAQGWPMTPEESSRLFLGMSLADMVPMIEREMGRALPDGWPAEVLRDLMQAQGRECRPIAGALSAIDGVEQLNLAWRVASNSSHMEMAAKFTALGILGRVQGRLHSFEDVPRGKPAPDVFLAAAAAQGVPPAACVVIEDSVLGARAAAAAGMDCLGFAPHGIEEALRAEGATPFASMFELPTLIEAAPRGR